MAGLVLSGVTAIPVEKELSALLYFEKYIPQRVYNWLSTVLDAVQQTNARFPFLAYGNDWLAFAHIMIAIVFIGPFRDPVRNKWVIDWGIICCIAVWPLAWIAGPFREIPWFHILIDCGFGIFAGIPLVIIKRQIRKLEDAAATHITDAVGNSK